MKLDIIILSLYFNHFKYICIFLCFVPKICKLPLNFPLHYSGKNRWQSLVPHFKESVGSYTASTYKSSSFNFNELQFPWQIIGKIYWWMSRRLYSDITVQSQYIDNWQLKRCSSEIGHTVKIQPRYSGSPQPSGVGRDLCSGSRD